MKLLEVRKAVLLRKQKRREKGAAKRWSRNKQNLISLCYVKMYNVEPDMAIFNRVNKM